jgi:hypothetical protein
MSKLSKKKRRPRSAAGERNYLCGCGKAYLSYPALYTHVKNKHDGIFPIGSNAKRKIPKNGDEDADHLFTPNIDKFYEEFADFISQIPSAVSKTKSPMTKDDVERFFSFKLEGEEKELASLKNALKIVIFWETEKDKLVTQKDNMNIYQIFAYYLLSIYPYCSEKFFRDYLLLIVMIIKSLNEKGEMFVDKGEKRKPSLKPEEIKKHFCEGIYIHVASEILNLFIAELFPTLLKKFKNEVQLEFLGFEEDHIKNLILMTKFLANWLFNNEFTDYRLEINVDL